MSTLFCRHNRFTADCPICSKGTVLDPKAPARRAPSRPRPSGPRPRRSAGAEPAVRSVVGPYAASGPYAAADGESYEVRLERVPGGIRLARWSNGALARAAPVLRPGDLTPLVTAARSRGVLREGDQSALEQALETRVERGGEPAAFGASPGRSGELREELRVERLDGGMVRVARWLLRPNFGWELQDAPPMLPAARYAQAIAAAVRGGVLPRGDGGGPGEVSSGAWRPGAPGGL